MSLKKSMSWSKSLMKSRSRGYVINNDDDTMSKADVEASVYSSETSTVTVVLFMLFGCAPSTSLENGLWCELVWFEATQPEGEEMGSWFALMKAIAVALVLVIMYVDTFTQMPRTWWVWGNMFFALITCLILALAWSVTFNGKSVFLYYAMMAAMVIGEIRYIMMIPWFVRFFNPRMVSPFVAGDPFMTTIFCIMVGIQQPGGVQTFSPTVFFLLTMIMYTFSVIAGMYIIRNGIHRRWDEKVPDLVEPWQSSMALQFFPPKWRLAIPFAIISVLNFLWASWLMPVFLPYAADNTTSDGSADTGENYFQYATILTYVARLVGSFASHYVTEKFFIIELTIFETVIFPIFIFAVVGIGTWSSWGMRTLLMAVIVLVQGAYGWCYPLIYRDISKKYPEHRGAFARCIALWAMAFSVFVLTLEWFATYSGMIRPHH